MFKTTTTWTRPDNTVEWPWVGLAEYETYEDLVASDFPTIFRSYMENDTTWESIHIYETEAECLSLRANPIFTAMQDAMAPVITARGITKTVVEETTP